MSTRLARRTARGAVIALLASPLTLLAPLTPTASAADVTDGLLLRYDLTQTSGTVVTDSSGHGRDGTLNGGGTWTGTTGLALDGVDDHVQLPDDVLAGLSSVTVSSDVYIEPSQAGNYFIWGLGNPAVGSPASGSGYLMATGNTFRASITNTWWNNEKNTAPSPARNLARGVWKTVTYTQTGTTGTLYEDGVQVGQNTNVTVLPSAIGNGTTTNNVLGESNYAADSSLKGKVRNFRLYSRALTASEVADISLTDANRLSSDTEGLSLGDLSGVTADLTLPTTGAFGSAIGWASSKPGTISSTGVVTRPGAGADPVQVTLTATLTRGSGTATKTFDATVLPDEGDQSKADAAAAALALVHPDDVRGHLTLPTTGRHASTVAWTSSAPAIVAPDGIVDRPSPGAGDASVTLTATVTVGGATANRQFPLTVRQAPAPAPYAGYAFSYFTGNSVAGEKIYFAASRGNNALRWDELNGGQPVLDSTFGEMGLRDPFLIRSPEGDRFFLIATDLSIGRNGDWDRSQRQGSRYLEIWESTDLKNWSEQRHVLVSPPTAGNTWAPEAYWDDDLQQYVVFWASKLYAEDDPGHTGNTYNRMLYATTRDFVTFSEAKTWQDIGSSRIDSTVIKEGDSYYRFTKDEGAGSTGCSDIIQEKNDSLTEPDLVGAKAWAFQDGCIGRDAGTSAVEGPTVFKRNPGDTSGGQYYLFVDEYGGRGYIPLTTDDLEAPDWKVPSGYRLPASPRHGTVLPVTQAELDALRADLPAPPPPVQSTEDGLIAAYPLTGDAEDVSGHGYDATVVGDATFADDALTLGGSTGHVKLPDNLMSGLDAITVSTRVWVDPAQSGNYFVWNLGNTGSNGVGNGYLFATGNSTYRAAIASGNWTTEQGMTSGSALARGEWKTLTYTLGGGVATLYLDGRQVARNADVSLTPGDIGDGVTTANYIGRSAYNGDNRLRGKVRDFRLWSRALSGAEVAELAAAPTDVLGVELDSLKVPAMVDAAAGTITLPVEPGTDLTALDPTYAVLSGASVSPDGPADYTAPVALTVTNGSASRVWTVTAVEMRSPVLPGLYADPNIAVFDGTYYIYATTDGTPGWGGKDFYVWSSPDLETWTRSEEPFLTLDGADGDVPWATGNAWAPTIIERGGKYYFYFSGHNASLNRKTIGVAVADSPTGPFTAQPQAMILNNEAVTSGQAIDPAAFHDPVSGKYYLYWGNGRPVMAELADDMVSLEPGTISAMTGLTDYREGSFMNYRDGIYHLTYAIDDTGSPDYRVGYATSSRPTGPWTYRGVILEKDASQGILGTGHSSIVQVPGTDEWYIAYHRFALPTFDSAGGDGTHRETTIDRLTFGPDGLIEKVVPTLSSVDGLAYTDGPVTASISDAGASGWYGADATLSLSGSGTRQVRLGDGAWAAYTTPVALPAGSYDVAWRARSANGQWSQVWTQPVKVDKAPPEASGEVSSDRVLSVTATDDASGVAVRDYRIDGGAWLAWTTPVQLDGLAHAVDVRAADVAGNMSAVSSLSVAAAPSPAPVAPVSVAPPVAAGKATVGRTLTATPGGWDQGNLTYAYQWLRDGVPIGGATSRTLLLGAGDVGARIAVQVTASRAGGPDGVARSASTSPVAKATSKVKLRLAGRSLKVLVMTRPASVGATGRVVLKVDGTTRKVRLEDGKAVLRLRLSSGRHTAKASYSGSDSVAASSTKKTVRIRR
ncbi:family 43 glycosylhydrolase [Nocardioides currus]|uniref:Beta-xylosidase n=1 Tax=Nocardioides currus TaxID=2133958 RepID=A0A2R7YV42_9ACTN|nr:family 43 glycosylhydrolase [Nocardioides currus]PUA80173.1 beta-xylosidase [Nocardioides currus]